MRERWIKECCNFSGEDFNKRYNLIAQENSAHNIMSSKNIDFDLWDKLFSVEEVQEKISTIEDCINSEPERSENLEVLSDYYRIYMLALDRAYENEKKFEKFWVKKIHIYIHLIEESLKH